MTQSRRRTAAPKTLALVLGGGGARGFAHICVLEALDEIGVRPSLIAGVSIGAAIGAAYAAGMSGKEIRRHVIAAMHRPGMLRRLLSARALAVSELMVTGFGNPMVLEAEKLAALFLPERVPATFEQLEIPLLVSTTDLYARAERVFETGPLAPPLAASMAIPGLVHPVEIDGRVLVDGAAVNPLPFDLVRGRAEVIVAVDASLGAAEPGGAPSPLEALWATIQVMGHALVVEKLKQGSPDLLLRPKVGGFRLLDFAAVSAILRVGDSIKDEVKTRVRELVGRSSVCN
jgi:NTE family protein